MIAETMIPPELVEALAEKTKANEIHWALTERSKYTLDLPECKLSLSTAGPNASTPDIVVEVDTHEGAVVGIIEVRAGDSTYEEMRQLLASAQTNTRNRLDEILRRAAVSVKECGPWPASTTTTPPPMPPPPSREQSRQFFERIAGHWLLDSSRGRESLRIDYDGSYYIYPQNRANEPGAQPVLRHRLTLEHCDSALEHVETAKRELDGRVRQIEVLLVSTDSMTGYAKHDAHSLTYTRQ